MGEETSVQSSRKTSSGHLRTVKQLITVALDLKRRRVHPLAFQSVQLDIPGYFMSQNGRGTWLNGDHSFKQ